MPELKFASAGDTVKVWSSDFAQIGEFKNFSEGTPSICWSPNNLYLVQLSSNHDKIYLSSLNKENSTKIINGEETEKRTCVCMDSLSRYVMAGGTDGLIHVWDAKTHKIRRRYQAPHCSITTLSCNHDNSVVAAASTNADVLFFNASSAVLTTLTTPHSHKSAIKQLKFSSLKANLLASVSDEGSTDLWDSAVKKHLHGFQSAHSSPSTAIAFSPLNNMFMLTAGLDKKIVCYDVLSKKLLKSISADEPLTSLDIFNDGLSVITGTSSGKILLYDLRGASTPVKSIHAHDCPVYCLCVQRESPSITHHGNSGKKRETSKKVPSPTTTHTQPLKENNTITNTSKTSPANGKTPKKVTIEDGVFSPCQDEENDLATDRLNNSTSNNTFATFNNNTNNNTFATFNNNSNNNHFLRDSLILQQRISDAASSIFSHISSPLSHHDSSISNQVDGSLRFSVDATKNPNISRLSDSSNFNQKLESEGLFTPDISHSLNNINNNNDDNNNSHHGSTTNDLNNNKSIAINNGNTQLNGTSQPGDQQQQHPSIQRSHVTNSDVIRGSHHHPSAAAAASGAGAASSSNTESWRGGSVELLRAMVQEEVEEAKEAMQSTILNMHAEMVAKFYQLQVEVQKMSQANARMHEQLIDAYNKLNEGNENLRFKLEYLS